MRLDPLGPGIGVWQANMGRGYFLQGRSDLAIDWLLKAVKSNPKLNRAPPLLAAAYAQKGDAASARRVVEDLLRDWPNFKISDDFHAPGPLSSEAYRKLYDQVVLPSFIKAGIPE